MNRVFILSIVGILLLPVLVRGQVNKKATEIYSLIEKYSVAREKQDTALLRAILTEDISQLVSNGEWRNGIGTAIKGMLQSSQSNQGKRTLTVDQLRFLDENNAIADARYEITNAEGDTRKMWSTFIVVRRQGQWRIAAIRNMLPSGQP